jgi:hypothetical protein
VYLYIMSVRIQCTILGETDEVRPLWSHTVIKNEWRVHPLPHASLEHGA